MAGATPSNVSEETSIVTTPMSARTRMFMNAYTNIRNQIETDDGYDFAREELTYIQADPRYLSYIKLYLESSDIAQPERATLLDQAFKRHQDSIASLNGMVPDPSALDSDVELVSVFDTEMSRLADDFYFEIEQSYPDVTPEPVVATQASPGVVTYNLPEVMGGNLTAAFDQAKADKQFGELAAPAVTGTNVFTDAIKPEDMPIHQIWTQPQSAVDLAASDINVLHVAPEEIEEPTLIEVKSGDSLWKMVVDQYDMPHETNADMAAIMERCEQIAAIPENAAIFTANAARAGRPSEVSAHYLYETNRDGTAQALSFPSEEALAAGPHGPNLQWRSLDREWSNNPIPNVPSL